MSSFHLLIYKSVRGKLPYLSIKQYEDSYHVRDALRLKDGNETVHYWHFLEEFSSLDEAMNYAGKFASSDTDKNSVSLRCEWEVSE